MSGINNVLLFETLLEISKGVFGKVTREKEAGLLNISLTLSPSFRYDQIHK